MTTDELLYKFNQLTNAPYAISLIHDSEESKYILKVCDIVAGEYFLDVVVEGKSFEKNPEEVLKVMLNTAKEHIKRRTTNE